MKNHLLQNFDFREYTSHELSLDNSIHVFSINVDQYYQKMPPISILSQEESDKAARFHQQKDRESYLVRKHCLRTLLSKFLNCAPAEIDYSKYGNDKPSLPGIEFNSSHTKNQVLIAVSSSPIGIDIEYMDDNFDYRDLLERCFSEEESAFILQGDDPVLNFYTLWTRKEAFLKATGEGIIDQLNLIPSLYAKINRRGISYSIETSKAKESYLISLATTPAAKNTRVEFWEY